MANDPANASRQPPSTTRAYLALGILLAALLFLNVLGYFQRDKKFSLGFPFPFAMYFLPFEDEAPTGPFDVYGYMLKEFDILSFAVDLWVCIGMPIWLAIRYSRRPL